MSRKTYRNPVKVGETPFCPDGQLKTTFTPECVSKVYCTQYLANGACGNGGQPQVVFEPEDPNNNGRVYCKCTGDTVNAGGDKFSQCVCPGGKIWDTTTSTCKCPDGQIWDTTTSTCKCPDGQIWDTTTSTCKCPGDQILVGGTCQCPSRKEPDPVTQICKCKGGSTWDGTQCKCPSGQIWDDTEQKCVEEHGCETGEVYNETLSQCVPKCTDNASCKGTIDGVCQTTTGLCQCSGTYGSTFEPDTGKCTCGEGLAYDSKHNVCVTSCSTTSPCAVGTCDTEGGFCNCGDGSGTMQYDSTTHSCVCKSGYTAVDGKCVGWQCDPNASSEEIRNKPCGLGVCGTDGYCELPNKGYDQYLTKAASGQVYCTNGIFNKPKDYEGTDDPCSDMVTCCGKNGQDECNCGFGTVNTVDAEGTKQCVCPQGTSLVNSTQGNMCACPVGQYWDMNASPAGCTNIPSATTQPSNKQISTPMKLYNLPRRYADIDRFAYAVY